MRKKEFMENNGKASLFLAPFMFNFIVLGMIPLALGILASFFSFNSGDLSTLKFVGIDNYVRLFTKELYQEFWSGLGTTALFTLVTIPLKIIIPLGLAFLLSFKPVGYKVFQALLYFPTVVSVSIVGVLFTDIFGDDPMSLMNILLNVDWDWLSNDTLRWLVIVLANIWSGTGTNAIILLAAINNIPKSLSEACEADGGNWWTRFCNVILPNIKGTLEIILFTSIINSFNLYGLPLVIYGTTNKGEIVSPMMFIQKFLNSYENMTGPITAASILFGLVIMTVTIIQRSVMNKKNKEDKYGKRYASYKEAQKVG